MAETEKQTWVVRYQLITEKFKMPSSFTASVPKSLPDGEARAAAMEAFKSFVLENKLSALFVMAEKI